MSRFDDHRTWAFTKKFLWIFVALPGLVCSVPSGNGPNDLTDSGTDADQNGDGDDDAGGPVDSDQDDPDSDSDNPCVIYCGPSYECCHPGEECVADHCLPACSGIRCGSDDTLCCLGDELCVGGECITPGAHCIDERDCEPGEVCEPLINRCIPLPEDVECRYEPPVGEFEPVLQWEWTDRNSIAPPLVTQLNDDNSDGAIDSRDIPDIAALTYSDSSRREGRITALSGDDGRVLWETSEDHFLFAGAPHAVGDIDDDGEVEIVGFLSSGGFGGGYRVIAFDHTGELEWLTDETTTAQYVAIALADLDGDGQSEIVAGDLVLYSDGDLWWTHPGIASAPPSSITVEAPAIADVDDDGFQEIVTSNLVLNHNGTELWSAGSVEHGVVAVAHVVDDDTTGAQVIAVNARTLEILDGATGRVLLGPINFGEGSFSGPPTVADFDADGRSEIGVAGHAHYFVFDLDLPAPHILWSVPSEDQTTGSVGSTVFDFDADGSAEVLYADECHLRILSGFDGSLLWHISNTSVTILEYPIVADVDRDGNAELVVVSSDSHLGCKGRSLPHTGYTRGVRVFSDVLDNWVSTRPTWNQHTYHIDNINDDGSIPAHETRSWTTHNTYRLNSLVDPSTVTLAPDLIVGALGADIFECPGAITLRARIENRGSRGVPSGVAVAFYAGESPGTLLALEWTTQMLLPGSAEWVEVTIPNPDLDEQRQMQFYVAVDDDGLSRGEHSECHEDNNESESTTVRCGGLE